MAGILLAFVWSVVQVLLGDELGGLYLVWLAYVSSGLIALASLACSPIVRAWVLLIATLPPLAIGMLLTLYLYPVYMLFPVLLIIGMVMSFDEAGRKRVRK
jgi:hypothetical protein